jgi:hypothetical protein
LVDGKGGFMKSSYEAPALRDVGSVRELTLGNATGVFLDEDFPEGTPFSDLTFS